MADWRQIQARIRKAKNSTDARTKLSELYQRTRDAMVSWELGVVEEKAEHLDEAIKWYTVSAERFRRADWKKKAEDALTRLGAPLPVPGEKSAVPSESNGHNEAVEAKSREAAEDETPRTLALGEIPADEDAEDSEDGDEASEDAATSAASAEGATGAASADGKKKRRRGRRGGRGRRRKTGTATGATGAAAAPAAAGLPAQAYADARPAAAVAPVPQQPRRDAAPASNFRSEPSERRPSAYAAEHDTSRHASSSEPLVPMLPSERTAHGRAGDPALASRMAKLDSMLRRLVASPLHKMDEVDAAPAGPGVFLLSDSDQITSYYVESCQTLRVGLGNLARGSGRSNTKPARGGRPVFDSGLKSKLAEHLGIGEAKVSQYLKDHCVVRWIQLDDDAAHLAHFAIGVLRTPLNAD
jgi:hypothetical protein